ncbi:MAG: NAD(P)/FAD-dependent oxidoreductase [Thermomicrobiales bacterium]
MKWTREWTWPTLGIAAGSSVAAARWLRTRGMYPEPTSHQSQSAQAFRQARHRVLILGGGFGGLATALELDRLFAEDSETSILLVDRNNDLLFTPLLWTVANGRANPNDVVVPLRSFQRGRQFHVLHAEITDIDLERREVATTAGSRPYDLLVIALGSVSALPNLPGLQEHALLFHTAADALELRNHLIDAIESAHNTEDPDERAAWLTFVVCGGGDTGIELAATIHEYLQSGLLRQYPWLNDEAVRIVVVGRADRLVPMSSPRTSDAVRQSLEREGVEVITGVAVNGVTATLVQTEAGDIPSRTVFWSAGITASQLVKDLPVAHAGNGALIVSGTLQIPDRPEIYVVGDAAWAFDARTRTPIPPTAQAAEHEAAYIAKAIAARHNGSDVQGFQFTPRGHLSLLGRHSGVANVGNVLVSGLPAWLLWHGYYLMHIPDWRKRLRLLNAWITAGITGRETGQLRLGSHPARTHSPTPRVETNTPSQVIASEKESPRLRHEDPVNEASNDSFPASDPPSWATGQTPSWRG